MLQPHVYTEQPFAILTEAEARSLLARNCALALGSEEGGSPVTACEEQALAIAWFERADEHFEVCCIAAGYNPSQARERMLGLIRQAQVSRDHMDAPVKNALQDYENAGEYYA